MECAMKQAAKSLGVAAVALSIGFLVSTTLAEPGHFGSGGSRSSYRSGYSGHGGGYYGGHYGGHYGGWGWRGWFPWGFSFVYAPSPYYYGGYYNYYPPTAYYPPPVVYSSPPPEVYNSPPTAYTSRSAEVYNSLPPAPVPESSQQPVVDRPLSPTAVDRESPPPPQRDQRPPQIERSDRGQSASVADVKALAKAGLSDDRSEEHTSE